ncbi:SYNAPTOTAGMIN HOMOLOG E, synaptotagmin 5, ARABIDOPSIS THALIANA SYNAPTOTAGMIN HOMOLOG E [Hibiscus trionum]|nr:SYNAPTOTAGMIN HOMOLOG E, synaptotagmin 5, ARABIDOPSIS THALIANA SYNAPTOTAGMIN HOMOLOG E [Hibiscus trionum]
MTVQDSRKILPRQFYPPWVVFSQRQKLSLIHHFIKFISRVVAIESLLTLVSSLIQLIWLNVQLEKIWPSVDEAASELIRASVEPILEQYTPAILSSMKFDKLTLGTVAPQFTGISILESESGADGITLEMDMQWDGNPNIVLNINTRLGVTLPVQVKDIGFTGVFRLIFRPLVDQFPCFGAVAYSLREKRSLDFTLKVVGGDLSSLPGVSDAIEETIRNAIEDSITWPVRNIVQIIPGDYSDMELKPVGTLDVKLVQAKDLTNKDIIGKSDPFAVLFIRPLPDKTKSSKTIDNQLNPIWNEHFEFIVEDLSTQHLTVKVLDNEGVQNSELIGCAQFALKGLEPGKVKEVWLKLVKDLVIQRDNKYRGQVQLELLYNPYGTESSLKNPFNADYSLTSLEKVLKPSKLETGAMDLGKAAQKKKEVIVRGVLSVIVISGENLPPVDLNGKADPFVVLTMKKSESKAKTRVANETLNPVWNQTFDFVVEDALHEMLLLEIMDHDTFRKEKIGRIAMTMTRVLLEGEFQDTFPLDGAKSGHLNLHLKWSPQLVFRDRDTQ